MTKFPSDYEQNMKKLLGEDGFADYASTFERDYWQGLRVNLSKISPDAYIKRREARGEEKLERVPWCDSGFYLSGETSDYSKNPDYFAGLYYLQEPSAMAPAAILPVESGDRVLDLCAAPGGKSTFLSGRLGRKGFLVSNDISPSRAKALLKNLEMQGATQAVVVSEPPYQLARRFPETFNKILVDAPCSGEGMFHKEPAIMKNWEQYGNDYYAKLQGQILSEAYKMLAPGGMLLYSTCTFSPVEDERMVESFLSAHEDLSLVPIEKVGGMEDGHPEWSLSGRSDLAYTARFWPHKLKGQGHFAALIRKAGNCQMKDIPDIDHRGGYSASDLEQFEGWCSDNLSSSWRELLPEDGELSKVGQNLYFSPVAHGAFAGLRVLRCGLMLGELKKDRFEPSQALALALKKGDCVRELDLVSGDRRALSYLKGETLTADGIENGWTMVLTDGYPLGWGKAVRGLLKNKYLKGWKLD